MSTSPSGEWHVRSVESSGRDGTTQGEFDRLREILLGDEQRELVAARARIAALEAAQQDLPQRLPAALDAASDEQATARIAQALSAPVASALGTAVRTNRQSLIDALFPVIGPLIRKSISEALRNLVADLNSALESSFTPRGIKWRVEAWRAGVPYAQVVLKHRLSYSVDHVFLIERESGLVMWQGSSPEPPSLDADAIAGMLTALGDFVDDSVGDASGGSLESARVGDHLVWVVQGPRANLACFLRGVPPTEFRERMQQRLEEVHMLLDEDSGREGSDSWPSLLQPTGFLSAADGAPPKGGKISIWPWLLLLLIGLGLMVALAISRERWNTRVEALRVQLVSQPGFLLGGIDSRSWRTLTVRGLLDPDAEPLDKILASADLGRVTPGLQAGGYLSTDDPIIARRAVRLLQPPDGVRLSVDDGVLMMRGRAPSVWIQAAEERAAWVAGVRRADIDVTPEVDTQAVARRELAQLAKDLANLQIHFAEDTTAGPGAGQILEKMVAMIRRAQALANTAGVRLSLTCVGNNDEVGGERINAHVREIRAQWLARELAMRGIADEVKIDAGDDAARRRAAWVKVTTEGEP